MRITVTTWLYDWSPTLLQTFFFLFLGGGGRANKRQGIYLGNNSFKIIPKPESMGQNTPPKQMSEVFNNCSLIK